jgi:hypothetical protein
MRVPWLGTFCATVVMVVALAGACARGSISSSPQTSPPLLEHVERPEARDIESMVRLFWRAHVAKDTIAMRAFTESEDVLGYFQTWWDEPEAMRIGPSRIRVARLRRENPASDQVSAWIELPFRHCPSSPENLERGAVGLVLESRGGWRITGVWSPNGECHRSR